MDRVYAAGGRRGTGQVPNSATQSASATLEQIVKTGMKNCQEFRLAAPAP
jgi:hypothetical protein